MTNGETEILSARGSKNVSFGLIELARFCGKYTDKLIILICLLKYSENILGYRAPRYQYKKSRENRSSEKF